MKKFLLLLFMSLGFVMIAQKSNSSDLAMNALDSVSKANKKKTPSKESAFKPGEWLKFRMHYGFLNASYATLQVKNAEINDESVYHVVGHGETTGFASIFFKVDDTYESYFSKKDGKPYKFIRKINEGGYTKDIEINFDYKEEKAVLNDKKNKKKKDFELKDSIQDLMGF